MNDDSFDQNLYNLSAADVAALTAAGYTNFPLTGNATTEPYPYWRCLAQVLENNTGGEPSEKCDGVITYRPSRLFNVYFEYSEASRAPTSIELGCADPNEPCNLPNALVSDPPLKQVVSRTLEGGIRGNDASSLRWSADYFFGQNYNDLLFVASEQTGFGCFLNFGKTRRDG